MSNNLITVENGIATLDSNVVSQIVQFEKTIKAVKEAEEELKSRILAEMEERNLIKIETDDLLINYIAPTSREVFDSKALREADPDVYDAYIKLSTVKSSIRFKLK